MNYNTNYKLGIRNLSIDVKLFVIYFFNQKESKQQPIPNF